MPPHKVRYYLERRDAAFEQKMAEVLCVYREVAVWRDSENAQPNVAIISYDEKPGIQAISKTGPDLPLQPAPADPAASFAPASAAPALPAAAPALARASILFQL